MPFATVRSARVIGLLASRGVELCLAVRPGGEAGLAATVGACAEAGVRVALWPMLADRDGRWACAGNAAAFVDYARGLCDGLASEGVAPAEVVVDLEPPFEAVRAAVDGPLAAIDLVARRGARLLGAAARFDDLGGALRDRRIAMSCAVVPLVAIGPAGAWEAALGTPVSGVAWDHVSAMLYSSILEGWSRGLLARRDAVAVVAAGAREVALRFGDRSGASLGAVGVGAFGDEPRLRSPEELREDVRAARAAGIDALTLLDLGGVLSRPPAEAWLDAFVGVDEEPLAGPPPVTLRADLAVGAAAQLARVLAALRRP